MWPTAFLRGIFCAELFKFFLLRVPSLCITQGLRSGLDLTYPQGDQVTSQSASPLCSLLWAAGLCLYDRGQGWAALTANTADGMNCVAVFIYAFGHSRCKINISLIHRFVLANGAPPPHALSMSLDHHSNPIVFIANINRKIQLILSCAQRPFSSYKEDITRSVMGRSRSVIHTDPPNSPYGLVRRWTAHSFNHQSVKWSFTATVTSESNNSLNLDAESQWKDKTRQMCAVFCSEAQWSCWGRTTHLKTVASTEWNPVG